MHVYYYLSQLLHHLQLQDATEHYYRTSMKTKIISRFPSNSGNVTSSKEHK